MKNLKPLVVHTPIRASASLAFRYSLFALRLTTLASLFSLLAPVSMAAPSNPVGLMEEGKALYESGRYMDSLGKFMLLLRADPQNSEARQYLRQVVDQMRQNPAAASARKTGGGSNASAQTEMRGMLQKRAAFTLGLKSIPGVKVESEGALNQVIIEADRIFPDKSGGLKEEGIPILDRTSAWLKTFGAQPVFIHIYPEELGDPATQGPLFLRRYSELYNFFVQERKIPAERFISTDAIVDQSGSAKPVATSNAGASGAPRIVIEAVGSQASLLEGGMPSGNTRTTIARWLEFAVIVMRDLFTPEEGEWSTLDVVALTRTGLRSWDFKIEPENQKKPVLSLSGKGNILKRLTWDGRDATTGSFVPSGTYVARLVATDSDGTIKTDQAVIRVQRITEDEPVVVAQAEKPKPKPKAKAKKKTKTNVKSEVPDAPVAPVVPADPAPGSAEDPLLTDPQTAPAEPAADGPHEIWKQVIQFELESDELTPAMKTSLERIGKTLDVYPLQKVRITGFAAATESGATQMAKRRAEAVRKALIDDYLVDAKRIMIGATKVKSGSEMSKVELSITN